MKKISVVFLAVIICAVMSCVVIDQKDTDAVKIHGHVHASLGYFWQCRACGNQGFSSSAPSAYGGCRVSRSGNHSYEKLYVGGSRAVTWTCVNCGTTTYTSGIPGTASCYSNPGGCHVWQR